MDSIGFEELPDFIYQRLDAVRPYEISEVYVKGHEGSWHSVERVDVLGERFYIMENDLYGCHVDNIAINEEGEIVAENLSGDYDKAFREIDGGIITDSSLTIQEAAEQILDGEGLSRWNFRLADFEEVLESVAETEQEMIRQVHETVEERTRQGSEEPKQSSREAEQKKPSIMDKLAQLQDKAKSEADHKPADISHKASRSHTER